MKYSKLCLAMLALGVFNSGAVVAEELKTKKDKESYGVGVDIANNFKNLKLDLNTDALFKGMKDVFTGKKLAMDDEEFNKVMTVYHNELRDKQMASHNALKIANQKAGDEFIAKFKTEKGVVALPSGLSYKIIKEGTGPKPSLNDTVVCKYKGAFVDGKVFDSSERSGGAVSFNLQGVIPGWQEALQLMSVGSHWEVLVPASLAYGAAGIGREIGPNQTLLFDIELLSINPRDNGSDITTQDQK